MALWAYPVDNLENWARFIDYGVGAFSDNILFARNGTSSDLTFEVYNGDRLRRPGDGHRRHRARSSGSTLP